MKPFLRYPQRSIALLLLWAVLGCGSKPAQTRQPAPSSQDDAAQAAQPQPAPDPFAGVHAYLASLVEERKIAGAVALVLEDGEVVYSDALGMRDVEAEQPMTEDSIFRICSMSKPITSVGVLMLVDEGRISLDDPVSKYIPAFGKVQVAVRGANGKVRRVKADRPITIRDLLTHTSGLDYSLMGDEYLAPLYAKAGVSDGLVETPGTMADNVAKLAKLPLANQPGKAWTYGLSVDVLGHIIEKVSGQTLADYLEERIFAPLGMNDTGFRVAPEDEARLTAVYRPAGDEQTIERLPEGPVKNGYGTYSASYPLDRESRFYSGGAGLVSTAPDYARFAQMLLAGGSLDGVQILKPETVAEMTRSQIGDLPLEIPTNGDGFGLGVAVVSEAVASTVGSALGSAGSFSWGGFYNTLFWVDPQEKLVAVVLTQIYPWDHLEMWPSFRSRVYEALSE
jgi:CubicO group peptidase (beta-lactamase class C family)